MKNIGQRGFSGRGNRFGIILKIYLIGLTVAVSLFVVQNLSRMQAAGDGSWETGSVVASLSPAAGLTISKSTQYPVTLPNSNLLYTISYANTGTTDATNVVIRDSIPAGATFISASNGGTFAGGRVAFNIGSLIAGSATQTVSLTVYVNPSTENVNVVNSSYTIEADGISPIQGPPVSTGVGFGPTPTPAPSPVQFDFNAACNPQPAAVWDAGQSAVGWYITPTVSMDLILIQTKFGTAGAADRNVTIELLTDRRSAGGQLLRAISFNSGLARGRLGGDRFTPLRIIAGTTYFITFRNINGLGTNTSSDAGATNCGACLYTDNANSAEGQYQTRGGSNQPGLNDQPILRLIGYSLPVTVSGRVVDPDGRGLRNVAVSITDSFGFTRLRATTSSFGLFSFDNLITGQTYTVTVSSRLYRFQPQTLQINTDMTLPDFVGLE